MSFNHDKQEKDRCPEASDNVDEEGDDEEEEGDGKEVIIIITGF